MSIVFTEVGIDKLVQIADALVLPGMTRTTFYGTSGADPYKIYYVLLVDDIVGEQHAFFVRGGGDVPHDFLTAYPNSIGPLGVITPETYKIT